MPSHSLNLFVPTKVPSNRPHRVEKEIKRRLSEIFQKQEIPPIWDEDRHVIPFPGPLTVTDVKISKDLCECCVFVMPLANRQVEAIGPYFEKATPVLRKIFAKQSTLRRVPHFQIRLDESFATAEHIETLLKSIREKEAAKRPASESEGV